MKQYDIVKTLKKALWVFILSGGGIAVATAIESVVEVLKATNGIGAGVVAAGLAALAFAFRDWLKHRKP